jgi:hypothetical protein
MGIRDLLEVMRAEALNRLKEDRKRRKESLRVKLLMVPPKGKGSQVERRGRVL